MEGIEAEIEEKKIERDVSFAPAPQEIKEKPKKQRTQKQIEAFEKARAKRAENLAKKKEQEKLQQQEEVEEPPENKIEAPPKKKRGRPRKTKMKYEEPPAQQFIPPHLPPQYHQPPTYQYQGHQPPYFMPHYHQGFQAPPPQPVNNYYYYGTPPQQQQPQKDDDYDKVEEAYQPTLPETPDVGGMDKEEEEPDYGVEGGMTYQPEPQLKYRFA